MGFNPWAIVGAGAYILVSVGLMAHFRDAAEKWHAKWETCSNQRQELQDNVNDTQKLLDAKNEESLHRLDLTKQLRAQLDSAHAANQRVQEEYESKMSTLPSVKPEFKSELEECEAARLVLVQP